jgi:hypothetical protein
LRKFLQPPPSLIWYVFVDSDYRWFLALEGEQKGTLKFQSTVISSTWFPFIGTTEPVDSWMLTTLHPVMDILSVVVVRITLISFPFITLCHYDRSSPFSLKCFYHVIKESKPQREF